MTRPSYRLLCATWSTFQPDSGLDPLPHTSNAPDALASALRDANALAEDPIHLSDRDGVACITAVEDFLALPGQDAIVYLASHGLVSAGANPFFRLATGDTRRRDDLTRALPLLEIVDRLAQARHVERKLLIIDACYSARAASGLL